MKIKYAFWGILIVFPSFMYSQKVECNESDFTDKSVYKKTKSALTVANNEFIKDYPEAYRIALEKYLFAYNNCSNNALLNYRIGVCYQKIDSITKSLDYWINSYNLDSTISKDIHYFLGIAYQKNFKFQEAIAEFSKYKIAVKKSEMDKGVYLDILKRENNCKSAMIIDTVNVRIKNLGQNINSEYSDYNLYVIQDTIYFTSRRKSKYNRLDFDGKYFERIFFSYKENGCWTKSQLFDTNRLSTIDFHMAVAGFDTVRNNYIVFESQNNFGLLYYASFSNRKIILHDTLPLFNDADYYYKEVCFDYKNLKNYVLMRPLNILGSDYYYFNIQNSKWSEPINVGYWTRRSNFPVSVGVN